MRHTGSPSKSAFVLRHEFARLAEEVSRKNKMAASVHISGMNHRLWIASSDSERMKVMDELKKLAGE